MNAGLSLFPELKESLFKAKEGCKSVKFCQEVVLSLAFELRMP